MLLIIISFDAHSMKWYYMFEEHLGIFYDYVTQKWNDILWAPLDQKMKLWIQITNMHQDLNKRKMNIWLVID